MQSIFQIGNSIAQKYAKKFIYIQKQPIDIVLNIL